MQPEPKRHKEMAHAEMGHETAPGPRRQEMRAIEATAVDHHAMMETDLRRRFFVALIFTVPILVLSPTVREFFGVRALTFRGADLLLFTLASVVVLYGGLFFYRGARIALANRVADMSVLVSLAVLSGYAYSTATTFVIPGVDFYWEISTLVLFLLFGHWMEMRAVRGASGALRELVKLIPPTANLVKDDTVTEVPTAELNVGDVVLVRPGGKVPIDAEIIEGESSINEAMITGESKPVHKRPGDEAIGGTINGEGAFKARVNKTGAETALGQIITLVQQAQTSKPRTQRLADQAASYLTLAAVGVGAITFIAWNLVAGDFLLALLLTITVLIIACPHALGLAIPTVTAISTTLGARHGLLIKTADALELAKRVDVFVFDKTGTLTKGEFGVTDTLRTADWVPADILRIAASIERLSEHVIAKGIVRKAEQEGIRFAPVDDFQAIPGRGAKAVIDGTETLVGSRGLMRQSNVSTEPFADDIARLGSQGKSVIYVAAAGELKGIIGLADLLREESFEAVRDLKADGIEVAMMTGDNVNVAEWVAGQLGLDLFFAEVLPEEKARKIQEVQAGGKKVAMVGDGINDAPALVQADIGIAIGAGTDVAIESANIVLVKNDPRDAARLVALSRATTRKMRQNLWWAAGYNIIAIPVAAGILFPWGIFIRPEWAALVMAASSIIVVTNALLLRRIQL